MSNALLSLIIFGLFILLFIWDKLPMATSAILGCVVMVILGLSDFSTAFGQFASTTVILLIGVMVVGSALAETGVAAAFGRIMTRYSRNNEKIIIVVAYVLVCVLSAFLTNATVLAIFMPIIIGMDTDDGKINHRNIVLPVLVATAMGGISTLVGSSQQLTANGLIEEMGYTMKVFDMTPVGAIFAIAGLLYCLFIGYPIGKKVRLFGRGAYAPGQGWMPKYTSGVFDGEYGKMIVSRGLSNTASPVPRVFNLPEIVYVEVGEDE